MNTITWEAEYQDDKILDPITFENIILMMQCNEKKPYTAQQVKKCYRELLKTVLEDAEFVLNNNIDYILKELKDNEAE